jgi:hypothetical protein
MSPVTLTQAEHDEIMSHLHTLNQLIPHLDALKACGVDCMAKLARIKATIDQLQALLQHFSPMQP